MEEKDFKQNAQDFVDMCFDNKLFDSKLRRKDLRGIEWMISLYMYHHCSSYIKCEELLKKIKNLD